MDSSNIQIVSNLHLNEGSFNYYGRYWTRTSDPYDVNVVL